MSDSHPNSDNETGEEEQQQEISGIPDAVQQITVRALQELNLDDMSPEDDMLEPVDTSAESVAAAGSGDVEESGDMAEAGVNIGDDLEPEGDETTVNYLDDGNEPEDDLDFENGGVTEHLEGRIPLVSSSGADVRSSLSSRIQSATEGADTKLMLENTSQVGRCFDDYQIPGTSDGAGGDEGDLHPDLVVLDPDHPLMKRFQNALKAHLLKQIERTKLAHREMSLAVKRKSKEREDLGVRMYGLQQELAKQQAMLEEVHDKRNLAVEKRKKKEHVLNQARNNYKENKELCANEQKRNAELQTEVENLATRLFHMNNAKSDVRSDIAVMKRAAERADEDVLHLESFKKRQDLYVDRLQSQVNKLREDIALYEAQQVAQAEETLAARHTLAEAEEEVESIKIEKKQLYQQWSSSLVGMKRRDEAHAAMQEALKLARQQVKSLETEINGYKRSTQKEEEKNETLTMLLHKAQNDRQTMRNAIKNCVERQDALKQEYSTYSRTLHATEQQYNKALMEKSMKQSELTVLRKQIEREYAEKVQLEDEIMKEMQMQLSAVKAQQYTVRITQELRARKKKLETQIATVDNEKARSELQFTEGKSRVEALQRQIKEISDEIQIKNGMMTKIENDTTKRNGMIERKQQVIDQISKKISVLLHSMGGEDISPMEIQINHLNKEIATINQEIIDQQQHWLRQQHDLVKSSRTKDQESAQVDTMKKSETILVQTKMRIEQEIDYEKRELAQLSRKSSSMRKAMEKINEKLMKENMLSSEMEQGNAITEMNFVAELKDAEMESIKSQEKLQSLIDQKEKLLKDLIDAERGIMLWEKKTQIARETKAAIDTGVGQEEMNAMKAEIHRMEVRYSQLMKQQEQSIREMEQSVTRRDFISYQGEARNKPGKKPTMGAFQKKLQELHNKVKSTQKNIVTSDDHIRELRENQAELGKSLEEKQKVVHELQEKLDSLSGEIENLFDTKQRNLNEIIAKQTKVKYLMALKNGKYTSYCKTEQTLKTESEKQEDRFHHTINILDRIGQEFPHSRHALRRIAATFTQPETS